MQTRSGRSLWTRGVIGLMTGVALVGIASVGAAAFTARTLYYICVLAGVGASGDRP